MKVLFQQAYTISGVATDHSSIATSDFSGFVRLFNLEGQVMLAEQRATQLNAVALRGSVIASDDDASTLKTGVAITTTGQIITQVDFSLTNATAIDKTGRYAVTTTQLIKDRISGVVWRVVPYELGYDKWPMGVELMPDGRLVTVGLDGYIRVWLGQQQFAVKQLAGNGCNSVDVSADGARIVVTHWGKTAGSNPQPGIIVLDGQLNTLYEAVENYVIIHQARFLPDNSIVYGTHAGALCLWDGSSPIFTNPPSPATPSKPGKHHPK